MKVASTVICLLLVLTLSAQEKNIIRVNLHLISKVEPNGLKLRWACDNPVVWQQALSKGYLLERAIVIDDKVGEFKKLTDTPIALVNEEAWSDFEKRFPLTDNSVDSIKYAHISYGLAEEDIFLDGTETFAEQMEYKQALETKFVYALMSADLSWRGALIQGLAYYDTKVEDGKTYKYRLSTNFEASGFIIPPVSLQVLNEIEANNYLHDLSIQEKDSELKVKWANLEGIGGANIEYSMDGINYIRDNKSAFFLLNSSPISDQDSISYSIDSLSNNVEYNIRVYGITPFGNEEILGEIKGTPRDLTPPKRPIMLGVKQTKPNSAIIQWKMSEPYEEDLQGFIIGRGNEDFGEFYRIHEGVIPPDWISFEDKYFELDTTNFYVVEAIDLEGNRSRSNSAYLTLVDSIAPKIPIPLSGLMDSLGIVTLELKAQEEKDFMGYRIYKANDPKHEFSVVQETYNDTIVALARKPTIIDTSTLESLTPFVYYHVTALDYHYNESKFSEVIKVPRPDKYPPVPPMFSDCYVKGDTIFFSIITSTSVDVEQNYLYGKLAGEEDEWTLIDSIGLNDTTYIHLPESSKMHEYSLKARDNSNLYSDFASVLRVKAISRPKPYPLSAECKYFTSTKKVLVKWEFVAKPKGDYKVVFNRLDKSSLGRTEVNPIEIFVIDESSYLEKINLSVVQKVKSYLPVESRQCKIVDTELSNDEDYIKYQKEK